MLGIHAQMSSGNNMITKVELGNWPKVICDLVCCNPVPSIKSYVATLTLADFSKFS